MSRSNYSEDYDEQFPNALFLYRNSVDLALSGRRGQRFLRDLIAALEAMPTKELIADRLVDSGSVCAIGAVGVRRGVNMAGLDPEDAKSVAKAFGIAECMAREITFENDEAVPYWRDPETPEQRWRRMRDWAQGNIKP
jgi:hypothetical protein